MTAIPVRVTVLDTWDEIALNVPSSVKVSDLKARALTQAMVRRPAADYVLKFRGALVPEGETTIESAGIVANAGLVVLPRGRSAVR